MKQKINGRVYDPLTANIIGYRLSDSSTSEQEWLYKKRSGEFFLVRTSKTWRRGYAESIIPMTYDEARKWAEAHMSKEYFNIKFLGMKEYQVIGGQYEPYWYGEADTLRGAKRIARKNAEYWGNWQGWHFPAIYYARNVEETVTKGWITKRDGQETRIPTGTPVWMG